MPSLPITLAFQGDLPIILPILPVTLCAMPQNADKSNAANPILLFHCPAAEKTLNHARFVALAHEGKRYRTYVRYSTASYGVAVQVSPSGIEFGRPQSMSKRDFFDPSWENTDVVLIDANVLQPPEPLD